MRADGRPPRSFRPRNLSYDVLEGFRLDFERITAGKGKSVKSLISGLMTPGEATDKHNKDKLSQLKKRVAEKSL